MMQHYCNGADFDILGALEDFAVAFAILQLLLKVQNAEFYSLTFATLESLYYFI
jgi:hypothetical protein